MVNDIDLLKKMYLIREFEKKIAELHEKNILRGTDHLSTGQEAIPTGLISQISKNDIVTAGHRVHHVLIAKGLVPEKIFAEIMGRTTGYNKGYAGIMHISSREDNFWGANGIVGANIAISAGIALGIKQQKRPGIVITLFGDGSTTQGIFHETLNMASLWDLPILFVCENNYWAQSTSLEKHSASIRIAEKVKSAYGIESMRVDGTDIYEVIRKSKTAIQKVRKGKPVFIEFMTYRTCGHSVNDKEKKYFTKKYIQKAKLNDPIKKMEQRLLNKKQITSKEISDMKESIRNEIEFAYTLAQNSKETEPIDLEGSI